MPETCNPKDCPVSARVEALKEEFNTYRANSSNTHRQMFERIGALEQNRAAINEKLDSMDEKLDELTATAKDLAGKPAKRWEALVSCIISALVGAFLFWLASGMPGVGE